ncbi:MAG: LysR family transcriptional regulator [Comamonas sp.]
MKLEEISAFVAVVRCQSLSQAAHELGLTQPAVTRRIQGLEQALGVELLDRNTKPPRPTVLGRAVHEQCRAILREVDALRLITADDQPLSGPLRLGLTQGLGELALMDVLAELAQHWPGLVPQVTTGWSGQLLDRIGEQQIDAAVLYLPQGQALARGLDGRVLDDTRLAVVAPRGSHGNRRRQLAELGSAEWILNPDGCGFRAALQRALAARGQPLRVRLDTYGRELQLQGVAQGLGLGLMPLPLLARSAWREQLEVVAVSDFAPAVSLWLVHGAEPGRLLLPATRAAERVLAAVRGETNETGEALAQAA